MANSLLERLWPFGKKAAVASSVEPPGASSVDLSEFQRATWSLSSLNGVQVMSLAALGINVNRCHPEAVPWPVIDLMGYDPAVKFAEEVVTAPATDPELYYIRHDDPRVVAEVEAWLRPLLPALLPMIVRAFSYGVIPIALSFEDPRVPLRTTVKSESGERNRVLKGFVRYKSAHELWPGEVFPRVENDKLLWIDGPDGKRYYGEGTEKGLGAVRAFMAIWQQQFGRLLGQSSRRRVYADWLDGTYTRLWRARYLERSVDAIRIGYAPEGKLKLADGSESRIDAVELLKTSMAAARNGSSIALPGTMDKDGKTRVWEIGHLELPDRDKIWQQSADHYDARVMRGTMAPPGAEQGKIDETLYFDFVQSVATFAAAQLTRIVWISHAIMHGRDSEPPVVLDNDMPKAKKRLLKEIFGQVATVEQRTKEGKTYTFAELIHPEIIEQLGLRARSIEEAARDPKPAPAPPSPADPGRPLDSSSDREERRDRGTTDEAENDTGGEREDEDAEPAE